MQVGRINFNSQRKWVSGMTEDTISPPRKKPEPEAISELLAGGNLFESRGYSVVKVTKGGKEKFLKLPIKSTGVAEYENELRGKEPKPPESFEIIKKDSPEGRAMGLRHDKKVIVANTQDPQYVNEFAEFTRDLGWRVAVFALDIVFKDKDGNPVEDLDQKKKILQSNGITDHQSAQIFNDVQNLTRIAEEQADFLSGN